MGLATVESQYLEGRAALTCGESTASEIDEEVRAIINNAYDEAYKILEENRQTLDTISDYLFEHETITGKEFMEMFRELTGIEPEEDEEANDRMFVEEEREDKPSDQVKGKSIDLVAQD